MDAFIKRHGLNGPSGAVRCTFRATKGIGARRQSCGMARASPGSAAALDGKVLLVGVTGTTGRCALEGLLAGGLDPSQMLAVTRNPTSAAAASVAATGVGLAACDLDDPAALAPLLAGAAYVYVHALSGDAASADPRELARAAALSELLRAAAASAGGGGGLRLVVYNGSAGRGSNSGISQMEQKHKVADMLLASGVPALSLEVTLFMEEFWKRFTRPSILTKGSFPFSLPSNTPLQLVAARDLGLAAAMAFKDPQAFAGKAIPLAADVLTPAQMADAFAAAQGTHVQHSRPPAWLFWFLSRDVWRIIQFLKNTGYKADVAACRQAFPGMLTFAEFLAATGWGDASRTYEQGIKYGGADPTSR